jgi:hypothetical protein
MRKRAFWRSFFVDIRFWLVYKVTVTNRGTHQMTTIIVIIVAIISFAAGTLFGVYASMRTVKAVVEGRIKNAKL